MGVPSLPIHGPDTWTDIQGLANLRREARENGKAALPAVARQFETIFTRMMIKSMRDAGMGGGIMDSPATKQWRSMFDNQIALNMGNDGRGLGIAAMLVRQLGGSAQTGTQAGDPTALTPAARAARTVNGNSSMPAGADFLHHALHAAEQFGREALHVAQKLVFSSPDDFVKTLAPYARKAAQALGVSPRAVLAQAALETGWGQHMPTQSGGKASHNLFGIKANGDWQGAQADASTHEFAGGAMTVQSAAFRAYDGLRAAFADYTHLLGGDPRYAGVRGHGDDVAGFAHALHRAGYATDPDYAAKLTTVANSATMREALAALKDSPATPTGDL